MVGQLTNHLINFKIDIVDNKNITGKHSSQRGLHLNRCGFNLLSKNIISNLRKFRKSLEPLSKPDLQLQ